jgi:hypothetical protein
MEMHRVNEKIFVGAIYTKQHAQLFKDLALDATHEVPDGQLRWEEVARVRGGMHMIEGGAGWPTILYIDEDVFLLSMASEPYWTNWHDAVVLFKDGSRRTIFDCVRTHNGR